MLFFNKIGSFDELDRKRKNIFMLFLACILAVLLLFYAWCVLFGDNSLMALIDIKNKEDFLYQKSQKLKKENAKLQKSIFELMYLESS